MIYIWMASSIILLAIIVRWDAEEFKMRVELAFSKYGVCYTPTKVQMCVFAVAVNYIVFAVIFER